MRAWVLEQLELKVGTSFFAFEGVQDALISAKHGELEQPNAVIEIADVGDLHKGMFALSYGGKRW